MQRPKVKRMFLREKEGCAFMRKGASLFEEVFTIERYGRTDNWAIDTTSFGISTNLVPEITLLFFSFGKKSRASIRFCSRTAAKLNNAGLAGLRARGSSRSK